MQATIKKYTFLEYVQYNQEQHKKISRVLEIREEAMPQKQTFQNIKLY